MTLRINPEGQVIPVALAGQLHRNNSPVSSRQMGLLLSDITLFRREHIGQTRGSQTDRGDRVAK